MPVAGSVARERPVQVPGRWGLSVSSVRKGISLNWLSGLIVSGARLILSDTSGGETLLLRRPPKLIYWPSPSQTLMLGKIEGRRGWQRVRWLDGITDSVNMSLSKLREVVKDGEAWCAAVHALIKGRTRLSSRATSQPLPLRGGVDWPRLCIWGLEIWSDQHQVLLRSIVVCELFIIGKFVSDT